MIYELAFTKLSHAVADIDISIQNKDCVKFSKYSLNHKISECGIQKTFVEAKNGMCWHCEILIKAGSHYTANLLQPAIDICVAHNWKIFQLFATQPSPLQQLQLPATSVNEA